MLNADVRIPGPGDRNCDAVITISLAELAEAVIAAEVPAQRDLLASVTAAWRAGDVPGGTGGWTGGSVGSGVSSVVLPEIVYPLLTGALAQVLGTAAIAGSKKWRRPAGRHARRIPDTRVRVAAGQVESVRSACLAHGRALGLTEQESVLLADALDGTLRRALAGPAQAPVRQ
jgi:hypothetical protein